MSIEKELDPEHYRDNPTAIAQYLTEILEKNDLNILLDAINSVMRAQNVVRLSKATGIRRRGLYKMFGGDVDPRFGRGRRRRSSVWEGFEFILWFRC